MGYYIDFGKLSLDQYKDILNKARLLPSQKPILEEIDKRFDVLEEQGLKNAQQLMDALKTKKKIEAFAKASSLPANYLTILRRELNGRHPKPRKLGEFPGIPGETKTGLEKRGIKTTVDLFKQVATRTERAKLAKELEIPEEEALMLAKLTDVSRLRYVSQNFATVMVASSYDTIEKIKKADPVKFHQELLKLNEGNRYYKGNIGLSDMKFLVEDARTAPLELMEL